MPEHSIRGPDHKFHIGQAVEFFPNRGVDHKARGSLYHRSLAAHGRPYASVSS